MVRIRERTFLMVVLHLRKPHFLPPFEDALKVFYLFILDICFFCHLSDAFSFVGCIISFSVDGLDVLTNIVFFLKKNL